MGGIAGTLLAQAETLTDMQKAVAALAGVCMLLGLALVFGAWYHRLARRRPDVIERFCPWGVVDLLFVAATYFVAQLVVGFVLRPWVTADGMPGWMFGSLVILSGASATAVVIVLLRLRYGLWPRDIGLAFSRAPRALLLAVALLALYFAVVTPLKAVFEYLYARTGDQIVQQDVIQKLLDERSWAGLTLMAFAAVVVAPIWEEVAFRGFLQPQLGRWLGPRAGLLITAVVFACVHDPGSRFFMVPVLIFPLALALGYARERTGKLTASILLHFLHNALSIAVIIASR